MKLRNALWIAVLASVFVVLPVLAQETGSEAASEQPTAGEAGASADAATEGAAADSTKEGTAADTQAAGAGPADQEGAGQAAAPAGQDQAPAMDGSTYSVRLRDLESRVDELKEQIRRSHTRLSLLSDTILSGGVGGARAEITFRNNMSSAFQLTRALFVLDGAVQYNKQDDTGQLAEQKEIPIFSGSVPPGDHTLQVLIQFRGHGYGVFSYLRGYKFEVKSSHSFTVTEGKTIELEAVAWEKGGVTTPLEQRPAVRFVEKIRSTGAAGSSSPVGPDEPSQKTEAKKSVSGGVSIGGGNE